MKHLKSSIFIGLFSASILSLSACSSMKVSTAQAPNVNLAQYKTFSWSPVANSEEIPQATILDQELKTSVDRQLTEKGLTEAAVGAPSDLVVSYTAKSKTRYIYGGDYYGGGYGDDFGYWGWDGPDIYPVREGTLSLLFVDAKTKKVVWKGRATDVIGDAGESKKQINEAVEDLFKKYPVT